MGASVQILDSPQTTDQFLDAALVPGAASRASVEPRMPLNCCFCHESVNWHVSARFLRGLKRSLAPSGSGSVADPLAVTPCSDA